VVGDFVSNYAAGLPSELGLLTLYDPGTGVPLAVLDATMITACRTGAMTAVGARYLARRDSRVLGHVGARGTAFWNVVLLDDMFDLDEIRVTSLRPSSREAFARQLAAVTGTRVRVAATAEEAFDGADILVEAINHPGFSFVEILSPCVTFRPDEREWKNQVHPAPVAATDDPAKAARRIMTDDGFNIGILYRGKREPYRPEFGTQSIDPSELEKEFEL